MLQFRFEVFNVTNRDNFINTITTMNPSGATFNADTTQITGFNLPLNIGPYFNLTLSSPNTAPLGNSLNVLNGSGQGTATFTLPAGAFPTLVQGTGAIYIENELE